MVHQLYDRGVLPGELFEVDGTLVDHYNAALEQITGKRTELESFHVDMRGESPELEDELGTHYLQTSPAHRYAIVVSPNQVDAPLLHEEFTFDTDLLTTLYKNFQQPIDITTRVDALYAEIHDGVRLFTRIEDLLDVDLVSARFDTSSNFTEKARRLKRGLKLLQESPELLYENDSAHVRELVDLVNEVGDVRNYAITDIEVSQEVDSFFTRLLDGVYVFRGVDGNIRHEESWVIYSGTPEETPENGPSVAFVPLSDIDTVTDFLVEKGYVSYSEELLERRKRRLEDLAMLDAKVDVAKLTTEERQRELHSHKEDLPDEWNALRKVARRVRSGYGFDESLNGIPAEIRAMLMEKSPSCGHEEGRVVDHLLTRLWPHDYETMAVVNTRDLERRYASADKRSKDYIVSILQR